MNGLQISLLTGLGAKAAVEYLTDIGIEGITPRQISYKGKDGYKDILSDEKAVIFTSNLLEPSLEGELHSRVQENFQTLKAWFNADRDFDEIFKVAGAHQVIVDTEANFQLVKDNVEVMTLGSVFDDPFDGGVNAPPSVETEPADEFDLFADDEQVAASTDADDLFADDEPDVDDLLDQPSVGAEAVDYDRGPLESDGAGVDAQHAPEATEEDDLFGDLGL